MKNSIIAGMILGMMIGAVGVTIYKPAQTIVKKSTDAVKDEAKSMLNKAIKN